jgi:hypothetical protein
VGDVPEKKMGKYMFQDPSVKRCSRKARLNVISSRKTLLDGLAFTRAKR